MVQWLIDLYMKKEQYCKLTDGSGVALTRKVPQCSHSLMTILFSNSFAKVFTQVGNVADCVGLDNVNAGNNQLFGECVQEAFSGQVEAYNNMHFVDDEALSDLHQLYFRSSMEGPECRV